MESRRLALGAAPERRLSGNGSCVRLRCGLSRSASPISRTLHIVKRATRASDRRRPARRAGSRRCHPAPARRPASHSGEASARTRPCARHIRARRARTRAGALASAEHSRAVTPQSSNLLRALPGRDSILRGARGPALEGLEGPAGCSIRDAIALSRIGGDGRPPRPRLLFIQILRAGAVATEPNTNWLAGALTRDTNGP